MNQALVILYALLCLALLIGGLARRGGIYEYPFLASAMSVAFILPQLPGLTHNMFLPENGFARALVFTTACLGMSALGWRCSARPLLPRPIPLNEDRLLLAAASLSAAGAGFYVAVGRLPPDTVVSTAISGVPVVLLFFSKMLVFGLAIAALCAARRPSWFAFAIILCDAALYFDRVFVTGKRGEALEFFLIVALALWFQRRRAVPAVLALIVVLGGVLGMASTEDYRAITRRGETPGLEDVAKIDFVGNFENLVSGGGAEFQNAIMKIDLSARTQSYDYGLYHWNELVMAFVPGQVVGDAVKRSLLIEVPGMADRFYEPSYGTTDTGMADAFGSFGYLGVAKFFFIAWIMRRIYRGAMREDASSQILYMLSALPAVHVISHHTQWIFTSWIHMAIFLGPALFFARVRERPAAGPALTGAPAV